ncbi:MAG: hypothetical protein LCH67_10805 [Bacteroidetes bacterium]|nr:hypothetical protein [Bacteroidota bacterium]
MKKLKFLNLIVFAFFLLFAVSCGKENLEKQIEEKTELSVSPISKNEISMVALKLEKILKSSNARKSIEVENEIKYLIQPFVQNGKAIHNEMITIVKGSKQWESLSETDKIYILSFKEDYQFVELSILYYALHSNSRKLKNARPSNEIDIIKNCVSAALGIAGIKEIIANTAALGAVETTIGALKLLGKRYLGYVGVAWMIWDFYDCYNSF